MLSDRFIGSALLAGNTAFMVYYILWIGVMPFVDQTHFTQQFFPPREYGLLLAALVMTAGLGLSITVASVHTILKTGYNPEAIAEAAAAAAAAAASVSSPSPASDEGGGELGGGGGLAAAAAAVSAALRVVAGPEPEARVG